MGGWEGDWEGGVRWEPIIEGARGGGALLTMVCALGLSERAQKGGVLLRRTHKAALHSTDDSMRIIRFGNRIPSHTLKSMAASA